MRGGKGILNRKEERGNREVWKKERENREVFALVLTCFLLV